MTGVVFFSCPVVVDEDVVEKPVRFIVSVFGFYCLIRALGEQVVVHLMFV